MVNYELGVLDPTIKEQGQIQMERSPKRMGGTRTKNVNQVLKLIFMCGHHGGDLLYVGRVLSQLANDRARGSVPIGEGVSEPGSL